MCRAGAAPLPLLVLLHRCCPWHPTRQVQQMLMTHATLKVLSELLHLPELLHLLVNYPTLLHGQLPPPHLLLLLLLQLLLAQSPPQPGVSYQGRGDAESAPLQLPYSTIASSRHTCPANKG